MLINLGERERNQGIREIIISKTSEWIKTTSCLIHFALALSRFSTFTFRCWVGRWRMFGRYLKYFYTTGNVGCWMGNITSSMAGTDQWLGEEPWCVCSSKLTPSIKRHSAFKSRGGVPAKYCPDSCWLLYGNFSFNIQTRFRVSELEKYVITSIRSCSSSW